MTKPKIAIVNSSSQLAICFSHLDEIARRARRAIELAGGVAFEVRTAAPSDFITSAGHRGGYILSARDLIACDIEVAVEGALLDGMLCLAGQVKGGEVVVLRGQGPTGSPGMGMASQLVFALDGAGLTGQVAVVTDGQLSGLVNKGIVVGEVSPEAARGGPLALVRDGDMIRIDVPARTADLDVPDTELQRRHAALQAPAPSDERGWLSIYQRLVRPLPEGAVLSP